MGLLTNGYRDVFGVFRIYGGTFHNNTFPQGVLSNYNLTGMKRNTTAGEGITDDTVGLPSGYVDKGWMMPQKSGRISSRALGLTVNATATGAEGLGGVGTSTISINASGLGGLIAGGVGTATLSITASGSIVATLGAVGESSFVIGAVADIGALGGMVGTAPIHIDADMISYAIGHMVGTTEESGLTVNGIVNGVWNAIAANYNEPGTTGNKLNSASAAGDPWTADLPGSYPEGSAGFILGTLDAEALANAIMTDPRLLTVAKFLGLK